MHTTRYLYNCSPQDFAELPYKTALEFKAKAAYDLITELYKPTYMDRDYARLAEAIKAEKHNQNLLKELLISE